jgi:hypothetical protein
MESKVRGIEVYQKSLISLKNILIQDLGNN